MISEALVYAVLNSMPRGEYLFSDSVWLDVEQNQFAAVKAEIEQIEGNRLLNTSVDDLVAYFVENSRIEVPTIDLDGIAADQRETQVDISRDTNRHVRDRSRPFHIAGTQVIVTIPFTGDAGFFRVGVNRMSLNPPRAEVVGDQLVIKISGVDLEPDRVRAEVDRTLDQIEEVLGRLRTAVSRYSEQVGPFARDLIEKRRAKLLADQNLIAALGFKLKERSGMPKTYASPEVKRRITSRMPAASQEPFVPEPVLGVEDYDHILRIIDSMALVMEQSPSAFVALDEEALRTHFLVQLNGHYEGGATGETFNYEGKTDILIREKGKNIFVGECKFWRGPKAYLETIDQLLGYSSWRDTKVAIIVFSRNKDFSRVVQAIREATQEHSNFKKLLTDLSETSVRFRFSHRDDPNRELLLTTMVFNVPT